MARTLATPLDAENQQLIVFPSSSAELHGFKVPCSPDMIPFQNGLPWLSEKWTKQLDNWTPEVFQPWLQLSLTDQGDLSVGSHATIKLEEIAKIRCFTPFSTLELPPMVLNMHIEVLAMFPTLHTSTSPLSQQLPGGHLGSPFKKESRWKYPISTSRERVGKIQKSARQGLFGPGYDLVLQNRGGPLVHSHAVGDPTLSR